MSKTIDKTKVIRVFETFAGIGAQHKAITNIKKNFQVTKTSEWDARSIIAYSLIHKKREFEKQLLRISKWSEAKIDNYLNKYQFSLNGKTPAKRIISKDLKFKQLLIAANIVNNNIPNIKNVKGKDLIDIDLLTYSFPCQGLSIANMGRDKGISQTSDSTSNLIWDIRRILIEAKNNHQTLPKYLLLENVTNLIGPKHKKDYNIWIKELEKLGYSTYTFELNALDFESVQKRTRLFAISILNKQIATNDDQVKEEIIKRFSIALDENQKIKKYKNILKASNKYDDEIKDATPNNTPSRVMMKEKNKHLDEDFSSYIFNTLTTKQDRHPNIGMISVKHNNPSKLNYRFITPRQAYLIMGFENKDFNKVKRMYKENILTKESLYRQAGNSIVVNKLEAIFKFISNIQGGKYE